MCSSGLLPLPAAAPLRDSKENFGRRGAEPVLVCAADAPVVAATTVEWEGGVEQCNCSRVCCGFGRGPRGPAQRGGGGIWVDDDDEGRGGDVAVASGDVKVRHDEDSCCWVCICCL